MEGDCNVYAHSSLWMRPTRPDRYNAKMVYRIQIIDNKEATTLIIFNKLPKIKHSNLVHDLIFLYSIISRYLIK